MSNAYRLPRAFSVSAVVCLLMAGGCSHEKPEILPRDAIERCLLVVRNDTSKLSALEKQILRGDIYVRTREKVDISRDLTNPNSTTRINVYKVEMSPGKFGVLIFSNIERLHEVLGDGAYLKMGGASVLDFNKQDGVILNYGVVPTVQWENGQFGKAKGDPSC